MSKSAITILIIIVLVIVGYFIWGQGPENEPQVEERGEEMMVENGTSEEMMVEGEEVMTKEGIQEFNVSGIPFEFSVKEIRVKEGDTVRINFTSDDGLHDWVVDEFSASTKQLKAGESETIEFVANKAGEFEYYCSVGNHRAQGMVGKLIVE